MTIRKNVAAGKSHLREEGEVPWLASDWLGCSSGGDGTGTQAHGGWLGITQCGFPSLASEFVTLVGIVQPIKSALFPVPRNGLME